MEVNITTKVTKTFLPWTMLPIICHTKIVDLMVVEDSHMVFKCPKTRVNWVEFNCKTNTKIRLVQLQLLFQAQFKCKVEKETWLMQDIKTVLEDTLINSTNNNFYNKFKNKALIISSDHLETMQLVLVQVMAVTNTVTSATAETISCLSHKR